MLALWPVIERVIRPVRVRHDFGTMLNFNIDFVLVCPLYWSFIRTLVDLVIGCHGLSCALVLFWKKTAHQNKYFVGYLEF